MPLVEVNVFEDELSPQQAQELIEKITDAITTVTREKLRAVTWVIVHEVKSGHWGVGGSALGLEDVRNIMSG
jgi:4-oxalocrotonate tautomerase